MSFLQVAGILRIVFPLLVNVASTYFGADTVTTVGTVLATVVAAGGWSAYANSNSSLTRAVSAQPGVQVAVTPAASPEMRAMAKDPSAPDVVPIALPLPAAPIK